MNAANGRFRLDPSVNLSSPRADLQVSASPSFLTRYVYSGWSGIPAATLQLEIAEDRWSMQMPNFVIWSGPDVVPEMTGLRGRIIGSTEQRAMLDEIDSLINPLLDDALKFLPGMSPRERPAPVELGSSNLKGTPKVSALYKVEGSFGFKFVFGFKAAGGVFIGHESKTEASNTLVIGANLDIDIEARFPITPQPCFVEFGLGFEVENKTYLIGSREGESHDKIEIKAWVAFGAGDDLASFGKWSAKLGVGLIAKYEDKDSEWVIGGLVLIEGELYLKVPKIGVKLGGELIGILRPGKDLVEYEGEVGDQRETLRYFPQGFGDDSGGKGTQRVLEKLWLNSHD